ncbi:MAG: hypothetical protein IT314_03880 [Anaerolineales bacterium]|nr:hypothetical protein [Anaerolineales bacterium]
MNTISIRTDKLFRWVALVGILAAVGALALYGYLGTFSRYGSDDYCLSAFYYSDVNLFSRLVDRYQHASSRYANILFIGLVDGLFGWHNVAILPPLMIGVFVLGCYLLLTECSRVFSLGWNRAFCFFLASLLLFFSLLQAPNLYETLYWRAGMTSHFAPLAFMPFLFVFLLRAIRKAGDSTPPLWMRGAGFMLAFILGGFSEPPIALLVTILFLAFIALWRRKDLPHRRAALHVLSWTFLGAALALITLALAPANSIRLGNSAPGLIELAEKTMRYPLDFIAYDLRSFSLPTLVSIFLPAFLFFVEYSKTSRAQLGMNNTRVILWMIIGSLLAYLFIAASFAPSVYGQNYPIARARFAGRVILSGHLIAVGAMLGILVSNLRVRFMQTPGVQFAALAALFLFSLYPIWASRHVAEQIPVFAQRAQAWDERDDQIRAMQAAGVQDVVIWRLPGEAIQDLQDRTHFRLNRCASILYDVRTILALHPEE